MPYSLSWQSAGLQNRMPQVRFLHAVPSQRAVRTLPGIHAEGEPRYKTERIHSSNIDQKGALNIET